MKNDHIKSKTYTALACIVGFALIGDLSANEQNSLGNWLYLVGQILETNYALQQSIEIKLKGGEDINVNSKKAKQGGSPFTENYIDPKIIKQLIKDMDIIKEKLNEFI